jgi:hypothetical protein
MPLEQLMDLWSKRLEDAADQEISISVPHVQERYSVQNGEEVEDGESSLQDGLHLSADLPDTASDVLTTRNADDEIEEEKNEETITPQISAYRDFISKSPAYEWLLESLQRECLLVPTEPDALKKIRQTLMECFPIAHRVSQRHAAETYTVTFTIEWDPHAFFVQQNYERKAEEILGRVITLTGSETDAQAVTCEQYFQQTWSSAHLDLGRHVGARSPICLVLI